MYAYQSPGQSFERPHPVERPSSRFTPSSFRYNFPVAAALLPSLAVLTSYGGTQVAAALIVGFMGAYILDAMRFKEGAFTAVWATLAVTNLALAYNTLFLDNDFSVLLALLALLIGALVLFLTGLWATLQFKWIQVQYPAVVMAFEKLLIAGCIPIAGVVQAWGASTSANGMESVPFFLAGILCGLYYLFGTPLASSFHTPATRRTSVGGSSAAVAVIQGRSDGLAATLLTVALPAGVYAAIHSAVLFQWVHLWSILLLSAGPLLFISAVPEGLWWLGTSRAADALRRTFLLVGLGVFLAGVEGRIVFHSFGQYIRLAAPWSYMAMAVALYGTGALVLLHFTGALGEETAGFFLGPVLMISSSVGGLVLGLPAWALPAPLLASAGLALFYDSRSARDYLLFVCGALATGVWFLWHHFWFLDVELDGMPLHSLCAILLAAMAPAFLVPGLVFAGARGRFVEILLLAQAALLTIAEERLFSGDHSDVTYGVHPMFPAALVVATSGAGLAMTRKLASGGVVGEVAAYALQCVYGAKLAMLVVPEARLTVPALGLALATTPPLLLQKEDAHRRRRLVPWQGLALAAAVGASVVAARYAVFDILQLFLNRRPSEALAAGALLLTGALGCIPLVTRYYPGSGQAKRAVLLTATAGLLLALLRPPLPIRGGAECPHLPFGLCPRIWDEGHTPEHELDDVSIYGDGLRRREHWPLWLLAGAAFAGLWAATSPAPVRQAAPLRLAQAAVSAGLVGGYMALEFFSGMPMVQIVVAGSALLVAACVVLLQIPSRGGVVLLPLLSLAWAASLPAALAAQAASALPPLPAEMERLLPDEAEGIELLEERREAVRSAVLASYAIEALLFAFALKLRISAAAGGFSSKFSGSSALNFGAGGVDASYIDRAAGFLGQCIPPSMLQPGVAKPSLKGTGGAVQHQLTADGMAWVPTACNLVTILCFSLCYAINRAFTGGDDAAVLLLAPILLLLCQDPVVFRGLTDRRRYVPPVLSAAVMLAASAGMDLANDAYDSYAYGLDYQYIAVNGGLLVLCLPTQIELVRYLWSPHRIGMMRAVVPGILAAVGVVAGELEAIRLLAGLSAVAAAYMAASARQTREVGRRII